PTLAAMSCQSTVLLCHYTPATEMDTLSLHDALPISAGATESRIHRGRNLVMEWRSANGGRIAPRATDRPSPRQPSDIKVLYIARDRKSTRLNSSHGSISYAVFCLKKKNTRPCSRAQ